MIGNNSYNFFKVLFVLLNQWVYCMVSLEGGKFRCVDSEKHDEETYITNLSE